MACRQATSHYLNQRWYSLLKHICINQPHCIKAYSDDSMVNYIKEFWRHILYCSSHYYWDNFPNFGPWVAVTWQEQGGTSIEIEAMTNWETGHMGKSQNQVTSTLLKIRYPEISSLGTWSAMLPGCMPYDDISIPLSTHSTVEFSVSSYCYLVSWRQQSIEHWQFGSKPLNFMAYLGTALQWCHISINISNCRNSLLIEKLVKVSPKEVIQVPHNWPFVRGVQKQPLDSLY